MRTQVGHMQLRKVNHNVIKEVGNTIQFVINEVGNTIQFVINEVGNTYLLFVPGN